MSAAAVTPPPPHSHSHPPGKPLKPLKPLDEALAELLAHATALTGSDRVALFDADGRVLAQGAASPLQVPLLDNSAMDGYALRCADVAQVGAVLAVSQRIPAGSVGTPLQPGTAARIFTGAPIPPGADTVLMQEDCTALDDGCVRINAAPQLHQWIRRAGEDIALGAEVLRAGTRLTPAELGLAASIGLAQLSVARRPRVALFSTGDELVMPGDVAPQDLPPGHIYNSNRFFLRALLLRLGCEVTDFGIVPDQLDATIDVLRSASSGHDVILTSAGVSVGEEDHVKPAVEALGRLHLWQIGMKPGKPFAYGRIDNADGADSTTHKTTHFMGLPGNPVASLMTFLLLVRPFVLRLQGVQNVAPAVTPMRADFASPKADSRREFLRVRRNDRGGLDMFRNQSSGVLTSTAWGDGVVDNPAGQTIAPGDTVRFMSFAELLS
ncbi:MAG: molybdopterin molybdotransferase MoeA [Burkholderiaceae bacterium]|nr:molybdopterin molybdotransferase MoeA [Burkholderiaceae bacterium]